MMARHTELVALDLADVPGLTRTRASAATRQGRQHEAARQQDLAVGYQALHEAYRQREATIAAAMADRAAWEEATRGQRELTVELRVLQVDPRCSADVDWHPAGKPYWNQPRPRPSPDRPPTPRREWDTMTIGLDLTKFKALSFDCYGTLIDWEAGIAAVLSPWAREQALDLSREDLLLAYAGSEAAVEREAPTARYPDVLADAFRRTGAGLGRRVGEEWAQRLGNSVPDWPAFPDSADALARLAGHCQLIIVSNVHRDGFAASNQRLHGDFAAVITAEDVGAYKPAENHFRALDDTLARLGVGRAELLHVAQSLFHDHIPAKREGLASVWINRRHDRPGWGATPEPAEQWTYNLAFNSMADFADAVDRAFHDAQPTNG